MAESSLFRRVASGHGATNVLCRLLLSRTLLTGHRSGSSSSSNNNNRNNRGSRRNGAGAVAPSTTANNNNSNNNNTKTKATTTITATARTTTPTPLSSTRTTTTTTTSLPAAATTTIITTARRTTTTTSSSSSSTWAGVYHPAVVLPISWRNDRRQRDWATTTRRPPFFCCSAAAAVTATAVARESWPAPSDPGRAIRTLVTNSPTTSSSAKAQPSTTGKSTSAPLPLEQLPGPKGWPFLGIFPEFLRKENRGCVHKVQLKFHEKYGRMLKLSFGPHTNVSLADPNLVEEFMRIEGKHPNRPPYQSWVLYKELRKKETGLMTAADAKWQKYRSTIAPRLMRPQAAASYTDKLNTVVLDLLTRIRKIRKPEDNTVALLQNELYKWATESVGSVLFGRRLGCLEDTMPQNIQDLIDAVGVMFVTGHQMAVGASIHKFLNTKIWQKHVSASDIIYGLAQEFIDLRLEDFSNDRSEVASPEFGTDILTYLLSNPSFSTTEIYSNMAELFLAGLDTASNSLGFAIYLLAKYPNVQEKLHDEISRTLQGLPCQSSHLTNMPYLKAVVKESMRLYPVIPIGARITNEDIVLDGYHIPKGTCLMINNYAMSRDEKNFPNANEFIPERWFRSDTRKFHPFAVIPFGHGSRSCIGRRIAELELYLAITHLCQNFRLTVGDDFEVQPFLRTVLTVGDHFPIQFVDR